MLCVLRRMSTAEARDTNVSPALGRVHGRFSLVLHNANHASSRRAHRGRGMALESPRLVALSAPQWSSAGSDDIARRMQRT